MQNSIWRLIATLVLLIPADLAFSAVEISVEGLMPNAAVLMVNGERKLVRVGQTFQGVTLVSSEQTRVTVEIEGMRQKLGLSQHIGSVYESPSETLVTIPRNDLLQYQTRAEINGRSTIVLVDTGANIMALSESQARSLGVDYKKGQRSKLQTASGVVNAREITLYSVDVGGLRVENVRATVVEGNYPAIILLGMSYLKHVNLTENNGILTLSRVQ
jgi:aspartyl protease family protein